MRLHLDRPAVVCTAAVSLLTAVAVVAPSTARADDGLPTQLPSVASLADAATTAATDAAGATETSTAAPDVGVVPGLDAAPVVEAPGPTSAEPSPTVPAGDTATQDTGQTPDVASQPAPSSDITPKTADTATDTPAAKTQPQPSAPSVTPTQSPAPAPGSANINVSVRIDSPGDNGPVAQVNVTNGSVAPLATSPEPVNAPSNTAVGDAAKTPATTSSPQTSSGNPDTWYWNWDCLGTAPISAISPGGSGTGSFPTSWTWIWNCGDNSSQYQFETPVGYPQINTNIAIRISSPGNDGSVTQVNVGAGVTIPVPAPGHGAPFPPSPVSVPPPLQISLGPVSAVIGQAVAATQDADITDITAVLAPAESSDASAPVSATSVAAPGAPSGEPPTGRGPLERRASGPQAFRAPLAPVDPFSPAPTSAADAAWRTAPSAASGGARQEPTRPPEASPRPRPSPAPSRAPVISASGLSAAAASGGGGSSGSGLALLLALPFVAALLDLARRVALEHATWPSGHRRRVPERPG